jgi:hypothetical protein
MFLFMSRKTEILMITFQNQSLLNETRRYTPNGKLIENRGIEKVVKNISEPGSKLFIFQFFYSYV